MIAALVPVLLSQDDKFVMQSCSIVIETLTDGIARYCRRKRDFSQFRIRVYRNNHSLVLLSPFTSCQRARTPVYPRAGISSLGEMRHGTVFENILCAILAWMCVFRAVACLERPVIKGNLRPSVCRRYCRKGGHEHLIRVQHFLQL